MINKLKEVNNQGLIKVNNQGLFRVKK